MHEPVENRADDDATPPLTRRELRRREREAEAAALRAASGQAAAGRAASDRAATGRGAAASPAPTASCRKPPLLPISAAAGRPQHPPRAHRHLKRGFGVLAMTFAVGMVVATSVPAIALLDRNGVIAARAVAAAPAGSGASGETEHPQSITAGDTVTSRVVAHDDYSVRSWQQVVDLSHIRIANTFTNDPSSPIQWPFPVGVPIASYFGPRLAPTAGASTFHEGVDFDPGYGVDVHAIADGVVSEVVPYDNGGLGVHVIIDHVIDGQKVSSVYGHMEPGSIRVHVGQKVEVTDVVGKVGSTGISTGPHLHFEIRLGGTHAVDPYAWLTQHVV